MAIQVEDVNDPRKVINIKGQEGALHTYLTSLLAGEDQNLGAMGVIKADSEYVAVSTSASDRVLGSVGAVGDYLGGLIVVVAVSTSAQVQIKDGTNTAMTVFPNSPGSGVGSYFVPLGIKSTNGAWKVTTGAGSTAIAMGLFS